MTLVIIISIWDFEINWKETTCIYNSVTGNLSIDVIFCKFGLR